MGIRTSSLESVVVREFWRNKRVFITGHTGFKGGWLTLWLSDMGAEVHGYALEPPTEPAFFSVTNLQSCLASNTVADLRDDALLFKAVEEAQPEVVFHLAAQPLVRYSYKHPVETYSTNIMGTVNLLECARQIPGIRALVNVTSDKCYENLEWVWPYRETDKLGGFDPYSSSKACTEFITAAYRSSFFEKSGLQLASVRAGNVIGGGDWAEDRLIPDFFRAMDAGQPLKIRSPQAVRPWQHVLEPLAGYLMLAERLYSGEEELAGAWNFGPEVGDVHTVEWLIDYLSSKGANGSWEGTSLPTLHEAHTLRLDISKAKTQLEWSPRWSLNVALDMTLLWHKAWRKGEDMAATSLQQVRDYEAIMLL